MSNPFIKAETKEKRLKLLMFGDFATLKSRIALQFPNPIVIDMEKGTEQYGNEFDFHVQHTTDADEVMAAVDWLLSNKHEYKTLIVDPITVYWAALQDKWRAIFFERKQDGKGWKLDYYELQVGDWTHIKAEFKRFLRKVMKLDMNVIVTAHQKKLYADGEMMKVIGDTFDGEKGLGYFFDTVVQTFKKDDRFMARAVKDRTFKLPEGEFELRYEVFSDSFGADSLKKEATVITLATPKQIETIEGWYLNASSPVSPLGQQKMLKRYDVDREEDLTEKQATEIIGKFEDAYAKRQEKKSA